jgi:hypothetical protein
MKAHRSYFTISVSVMLLRLACFALGALTCLAQPSSVPMSKFWRTDGSVLAILVTNDTVYLGGQFTYVGPDTGSAGVVDATTAQLRKGFPAVNGTVLSAASDGQGGWFMAGSFSSVGGIQRSNLAHVLADNHVDPAWNPQANGSNTVILVSGNIVYVGGAFTRLGSLTRNRIAALDAVTGQPTSWNPNANQIVSAMALVDNLLYVGGNFTTIGGSNRSRLAALTPATGFATSWNPGASALVNDIEIVGTNVYVCGAFITVGGSPRNRIAALSTLSDTALDWNPNANGAVLALAAMGNTVYAAGLFNSIGSFGRNRIAALDTTTGVATDWNPDANDNVRALEVSGNTVFAAGDFTSVGGQARAALAALDTSTGTATTWNPQVSTLTPATNASVSTIVLAGSDLFIGGSFNSVGGVSRRYIAALDVATGEATGWDPRASSNVTALAYADNTIYAGGVFTNIGGAERLRLAALNTNGVATSWNPNVLGRASVGIFALLAADANQLYVGGNFTNISGTARNSLALLSRSVATVQPWNPSPGITTANQSPSINAMLLSGNTLYVGGDFSNNGGQPRLRLAGLDITTGNAQAFNPGASNPVTALVLSGNTLYVGGAFTNIGGQVRGRVAALDIGTGTPTIWNPDASGAGAATRVNALALANNSIYVGGEYAAIGGEFRNRAAGVRIANGQSHDWNPDFSGAVRALYRTPDAIYVGGDFATIGGRRHTRFAVFSAAPVFTSGTQQRLPDGTFHSQMTSGDGVRLIVRATEDLITWSTVYTNLNLNGSSFIFDDPGAVGPPQRFYQALLETQ